MCQESMFKFVVVAASTVKTIILLVTALLVIIEAKSIFKRSTDNLFHNSCGVILNNTIVTTNTPLIITAEYLMTRTEDVHYAVKELKSQMSNRIPQHVVNHLDSLHFMDKDNMLINANTKQTFTDEPASGMFNLYRHLNELFKYIQHTRTRGLLSTLSAEQPLRDDLTSIETSFNSIICLLKIELLNTGVETKNIDTFSTLSSNFLKHDGNLTNELYRAYVVIGDTERYISYLNTMFTVLHSQLSANEN